MPTDFQHIWTFQKGRHLCTTNRIGIYSMVFFVMVSVTKVNSFYQTSPFFNGSQ